MWENNIIEILGGGKVQRFWDFFLFKTGKKKVFEKFWNNKNFN